MSEEDNKNSYESSCFGDNENSTSYESNENQLTPCAKIRVLISGLQIHVQYNNKFGYIGEERKSEGTILYRVLLDTHEGENIIVKRKHLKFLEEDGKIDAIIINQCGDMQEYRVPRPNDKIYEPILCPKLSQYYNKKFFCYPYLPNEKGEENDIPVFSKIKWFQQQFFNKLELNYVAQLLTENENLEPSSYILFAENFEYITFCDAIKYKNMLQILRAISDSNSEEQSVSILSTLKNIERRLDSDQYPSDTLYNASNEFLRTEFINCYVYEEGYVFIDDTEEVPTNI